VETIGIASAFDLVGLETWKSVMTPYLFVEQVAGRASLKNRRDSLGTHLCLQLLPELALLA
jgi:hypothetical protein